MSFVDDLILMCNDTVIYDPISVSAYSKDLLVPYAKMERFAPHVKNIRESNQQPFNH